MSLKKISLICILMLMSCAAPKKFFVSPSYSIITQGEMAIYAETPTVAYEGSMENEFGKENQIDSMRVFLINQIGMKLKDSLVIPIKAIKDIPSLPYKRVAPGLFDKNDFTKKYTVSIDIKTPGGRLGGSDYSLIIQEIRIVTEIEAHGYMANGTGGGYIDKGLFLESKYLLWDNNKSQIIYCGYGSVGSRSFFVPIITMHNWEDLAVDLAEEICKSIPIQKKSTKQS